MVIPITRGLASMITSRQVFPITIGIMATPTTINRVLPIGIAAVTTNIGLILNETDINKREGTV